MFNRRQLITSAAATAITATLPAALKARTVRVFMDPKTIIDRTPLVASEEALARWRAAQIMLAINPPIVLHADGRCEALRPNPELARVLMDMAPTECAQLA